MVAMFTKIDSLPGSQKQPAVGDGDGKGISNERRLDMSRHIIWTFVRMDKVRVFAADIIHGRLEIDSNLGIGVLVDGQAG